MEIDDTYFTRKPTLILHFSFRLCNVVFMRAEPFDSWATVKIICIILPGWLAVKDDAMNLYFLQICSHQGRKFTTPTTENVFHALDHVSSCRELAVYILDTPSLFHFQLWPVYCYSIVFPYSRGQKLTRLKRPLSGAAVIFILLTDLFSGPRVVTGSSCFSDRNIWDFLSPEAAVAGMFLLYNIRVTL